MAKVTVKFVVKANAKKAYIVGSSENLGAWNPANAVALTKEDGVFTLSKQFDADAYVEFKVLAGKTFDAVEKGVYGEEVANRTFTATKGLKVEAQVANFAK
ncbi:MAG: hypothetical protein IKP12_06835 [Acholeplasmatales bacterium]|nr:hypothetical protein [Acholeplasmatales bacterium]